MTKTAWLFFFLFAFAVLGYIREFFFVHLNILMFEKYYNSVSPARAPVMDVFKGFSYDTLYYSKYLYTLLSTLLFFGLNYLAVKKLTSTSYFTKVLLLAYLIMLSLSVLSMIYGYFINGRLQDDEYTVSRWLIGIAQSPIICLILVASEKLYNKSFQS